MEWRWDLVGWANGEVLVLGGQLAGKPQEMIGTEFFNDAELRKQQTDLLDS
jgi:hypothetical protein